MFDPTGYSVPPSPRFSVDVAHESMTSRHVLHCANDSSYIVHEATNLSNGNTRKKIGR
jgi:hypothetical protein